MINDSEIIIAWWEKSEKNDLFGKAAGGFGGVGSLAIPEKLCSVYPLQYLTLKTVFPVINLPQSCYVMTIGSSTQHIYPA